MKDVRQMAITHIANNMESEEAEQKRALINKINMKRNDYNLFYNLGVTSRLLALTLTAPLLVSAADVGVNFLSCSH